MAAFTSAIVGPANWNDGATWGKISPGVKGVDWPGNVGDTFTIAAGHTVIYNVSEVNALGLSTINGTLTFSRSMTTRLVFSHNYLNVESGGYLKIGESSTDFIPQAYTATIEFTTTSDAARGLIIKNGATCYIFGDPDYIGPNVGTQVAEAWTSGTSFTVQGDMSGWKNGQTIVVGKNTSVVDHVTNCYFCVVSSATYNAGTDKTTVVVGSFPGPVAKYTPVVNLSRNVRVQKFGGNFTSAAHNTNTSLFMDQNAVPRSKYHDVALRGVYAFALSVGALEIEKCVVQNGSDNGSGFYFYTAATMQCNVNKCVAVCMAYGFQGAAGNASTVPQSLSNSYAIACSSLFYSFRQLVATNCYGAGSYSIINDCEAFEWNGGCHTSSSGWLMRNGVYGILRSVDIYRCAAQLITYPGRLEMYDCYVAGMAAALFGSSDGVIWRGGGIGVRRDGTTELCTSALLLASSDPNITAGIYQLSNVKYVAPSLGLCVTPVLANVQYPRAIVYMENVNCVEGVNIIVDSLNTTIYSVNADGTGDNPNLRTGGNLLIQEITPAVDIGLYGSFTRIKCFEHRIWKQAGPYTVKYYVQTDFASLPAAECYLECEYRSSAIDTSTTMIKSANAIATRVDQSDWSQFMSVTINTLSEGWITLDCYVAGYESGKKVWIDPLPNIA